MRPRLPSRRRGPRRRWAGRRRSTAPRPTPSRRDPPPFCLVGKSLAEYMGGALLRPTPSRPLAHAGRRSHYVLIFTSTCSITAMVACIFEHTRWGRARNTPTAPMAWPPQAAAVVALRRRIAETAEYRAHAAEAAAYCADGQVPRMRCVHRSRVHRCGAVLTPLRGRPGDQACSISCDSGVWYCVFEPPAARTARCSTASSAPGRAALSSQKEDGAPSTFANRIWVWIGCAAARRK